MNFVIFRAFLCEGGIASCIHFAEWKNQQCTAVQNAKASTHANYWVSSFTKRKLSLQVYLWAEANHYSAGQISILPHPRVCAISTCKGNSPQCDNCCHRHKGQNHTQNTQLADATICPHCVKKDSRLPQCCTLLYSFVWLDCFPKPVTTPHCPPLTTHGNDGAGKCYQTGNEIRMMYYLLCFSGEA